MAASASQRNNPSQVGVTHQLLIGSAHVNQLYSLCAQCNVVVAYPGHVCVIDGGSLVNVIKTYVQNRSSGMDVLSHIGKMQNCHLYREWGGGCKGGAELQEMEDTGPDINC